MSEDDYRTGYCNPPKAYQYQQGQTGNAQGRPPRPPQTLARLIEDSWMETISITTDNGQMQVTNFELISLHLIAKIAEGSRKALRVFRKYEAFAKTKPRLRRRRKGGLTYEQLLGLEPADNIGELNKSEGAKSKALETPEERDRRKMAAKVARMKAGLEEIHILHGMTPREAGDLYDLFLRQPFQPKRPRMRPRKGRREASEIFDQVINSQVTMNSSAGFVKAPRMVGLIKRLVAHAVRGDIKCADMLVTLRADSVKLGDFVPKTKYLEG
jgi:hypothetical protein